MFPFFKKSFKQQVPLNSNLVQFETYNQSNIDFCTYIVALKNKRHEFEEKAKNEVNSVKYKNALEALSSLIACIDKAKSNFDKNRNLDEFKENVNTALEIAKDSKLKEHRNEWKRVIQISCNLLMSILSVFNPGNCVIKSTEKNNKTHNPLFFSHIGTQSIKHINQLQNSLVAITLLR